jgi:hypothetical protein
MIILEPKYTKIPYYIIKIETEKVITICDDLSLLNKNYVKFNISTLNDIRLIHNSIYNFNLNICLKFIRRNLQQLNWNIFNSDEDYIYYLNSFNKKLQNINPLNIDTQIYEYEKMQYLEYNIFIRNKVDNIPRILISKYEQPVDFLPKAIVTISKKPVILLDELNINNNIVQYIKKNNKKLLQIWNNNEYN